MDDMDIDKNAEQLNPGKFSKAVEEVSSPASQAVIGPKISIKGEVIGEEDIIIQGHIEGSVDFKNHTLTVGRGGKLIANASAKEIIINGNVEGDLFGEKRVVILKEGNVQGNIVASGVSIEDGAQFHGAIEMNVSKKRTDAPKASVTPAATTNVAQTVAESQERTKRELAMQQRRSADKERSAKIAAASQEKIKRALAMERKSIDKDRSAQIAAVSHEKTKRILATERKSVDRDNFQETVKKNVK